MEAVGEVFQRMENTGNYGHSAFTGLFITASPSFTGGPLYFSNLNDLSPAVSSFN